VLQPFAVAQATLDNYRRYVRSSFPLKNQTLDEQREALIDSGLLWTEPYVSLARPGVTGPKLASLTNLLLDQTLVLPWGFDDLFGHQHRAIERLAPARTGGPQNTLILSGTGSGKTESFLIPITDACLRNPGPGVKALIIYPMNALANDQLNRLQGLLASCPAVTFGRYTGDSPESDEGDERRPARPANFPPNGLWSRRAMRDKPPNILLTNYTQLEYLLLRRRDAELFRHGFPRYLVVDEIHLFLGVLGAEVACLIRRFRQHGGAAPGDICMVGTSATAGSEDEHGRLLEFAERFFGAPFDADAAIAETPAPFRPLGGEVLLEPVIEARCLAEAHRLSGLVQLARAAFGLDLPADESFGEELGRQIDRYKTVGVVERALAQPAPIGAAAAALSTLPERANADQGSLQREATAIVLLGAAALQQPVGEGEPQPRFRPRLHQVVRSLTGLWQCLKPGCGRLNRPGQGRCPSCGSLSLPIASCRTCGESFWSSPASTKNLEGIFRLMAVERRHEDPGIFLADPASLPHPVENDEEGGLVIWEMATICPVCGTFARGTGILPHDLACPVPAARRVLASTDDVHCPSCGDLGARDRPILLSLHGSAAASVAVLTQSLSDELRRREGEAGGRLLVFADSRQDAAQQAGYADDQGARIAIRQLITHALGSGPLVLPKAVRKVQGDVTEDRAVLRRWIIGESDVRFSEVSDPRYEPSQQDEEAVRHQLEWESALEVTERSRRRFSLEQEGILVVEVDRLDELADAVSRMWPNQPFGSPESLREVIRATVDVLRYGRAVDHWMLKLTPRGLSKNHHVRIGDRGVTATRGYSATKFRSNAQQVDLRGWTAKQHVTRMTELIGRVLDKKPIEVNPVVESLASRLHAAGLLTESLVEGRKRQMVDHKRLVLTYVNGHPLWRCERCGAVRGTLLKSLKGEPLCANWRCPGRPVPFRPIVHRDFYRKQYLAEARRLIVREHSGQVEGEERIALEERFNDREHPSVDALACTPTLEVGVSLDDLHGVVLRNLPPTPANYAQRVGRAGRRSKVAIAVAHAGQGPHDSYFFDRPGEMIAGLVRAPAISLNNEPLLRRHINSLILETLGVDLPVRWVPPIDEEATFEDQTVADEDGLLRETTIEPFAAKLQDGETSKLVDAAVRGAFASPEDPSPPAGAPELCERQIALFLPELRAALNRWCNRYKALLDELARVRRARGVRTKVEKDLEARLEAEIRRMAEPKSPEYQPLGFLGLVGFLPRYGFTGESVLLHPPQAEESIVQSAQVAVSDFAPENIVYARGRKLKVRRLDPAPVLESEAGVEHRDNVMREGRRCSDCEVLVFDPLTKSCPICTRDLIGQRVVELTGVSASGGAISSEDEYRTRSEYDIGHTLGPADGVPDILTIGGLTIDRTTGRQITVVNRGLRMADGSTARGFDVCIGCGFATDTEEEKQDQDEDQDEEPEASGHTLRCPGRKDRSGQFVKQGVWLTARIRGDVIEIVLPQATRTPGFFSWRLTLAEALKIGVRQIMQAGQRDLASFEARRNAEPFSIVIYDTMPGGTGYIPKLFANSGEGLKQAAAESLGRLENCDCSSSCHRCLRDFWNQRVHHLLNRFEVLPALRRLTEGRGAKALDPENEKLESFLEIEFFAKLAQAGLPAPTLQVVRELGGRRIIRVDAEYRDPDISIFLDGRAYHAGSREKVISDLKARNQLEQRGVCVLEFTLMDVLEHFETVATAIKRALKRETADPGLNLDDLPEISLKETNKVTKLAHVQVDAEEWVRNESIWRASLHSANRARLAGWRLVREPIKLTTEVGRSP